MPHELTCPQCGYTLTPANSGGRPPGLSDDAAIGALVERLRDVCREAGHTVSLDDRVDEAAAAACLGLERVTLRNRRYINGADFLPYYKHTRSVSYALQDIARYIVGGRR